MIVRNSEAEKALCITQLHHSEMTGALAAAWKANDKNGMPPALQFCITAARIHDIGWLDWEGAPDLSPENQHPLDFLNMPKRRHLEIWRNGFYDACALHPLLGLLVLRHNMTLAGTDTDVASPLREELEAFFKETSEIDAELEKRFTETGYQPAFGEIEAAGPAPLKLSKKELEDMNAFILLTDYISLRMCMGPQRPNPFGPPPGFRGQAFRFETCAEPDTDGAEVSMMAPWPFSGRVFEWQAPAWEHQRGQAFSCCKTAATIQMRLKPFQD
jgi:hypothetical protein